MKNRFSTLDVAASVNDIRVYALGMRVVNVYDIDSKTYLLKLQKPEHKCVILFECGMRLHRTSFDWPKAQFPSSFSMKFRKHIKQKRLESIRQLGVDRVVDMQFGEDTRACHVIVELYDRGNIVLTDHNYIILNVLRPRTDKNSDVKFSVKERYPIDIARKYEDLPDRYLLRDILRAAKKKDMLRRVLSSKTPFGPPIVEHGLIKNGFAQNFQMTGESDIVDDAFIEKVQNSLLTASKLTDEVKTVKKGFVIYKKEFRADGEELQKYEEYHPVLFEQFLKSEDPLLAYKEYDSFGDAVDEFYSKIEEQKSQQRAVNAERAALKKLENVKKDQTERVEALKQAQIDQEIKAGLILTNTDLVDRAILVIQSAIANKLSWDDIDEKRAAAAAQGDPVAQSIVRMDLGSNHITLLLEDAVLQTAPMEVDIDLALTVYQNSRKYFSDKKAASKKEQKTVESSEKALKSAQAKTKETIDKVNQKVDALVRQRKPMWFEKFFWFISSENYLVIGGRDAHQNEMLVKRYLRANDVYVHADVRGASSVVVRNKGPKCEDPIPPKTLEEAGTFSICYSTAWEAKVVVNAWWVRQDQVSRTAPTGEYLPTGSFMIRGKKNYLPGSQMQMGFGLLFRLDEDSLERHQGERKVCASVAESIAEAVNGEEDKELQLSDTEELNEKSDGEADDSDSESEEPEFPDVQIGLAATRFSRDDQGEEYSILQLGPSTGKGGRRQKTAREQYLEKLREEEEKAKAEERKKLAMGQFDKSQLTKRQKHKMDKIKKKYKDQDDEERSLRLELLASSNKPKAVKGKRRQRQAEAAAEEARQKFTSQKKEEPSEEKDVKPIIEENLEAEVEDENDEGADEDNLDDDESKEDEDEKIINSLTWKPVNEDTLLNVVAVVAPYQAMNGFKFKVKLTPGTGKRGKAAKSAMALFQRDKAATAAEEKLITALAATDERLAHSIPGKVRVSAPELFRKKK